MLAPHALPGVQVLVEQADHRSEGMHHQPFADQPAGVGQALGMSVVSRQQQQTWCADPVGTDNGDPRSLLVLHPVGVDIQRPGDQAIVGHQEPLHPGAGDERDPPVHSHRPVGAIDRRLRAFGAAPQTSRTL